MAQHTQKSYLAAFRELLKIYVHWPWRFLHLVPLSILPPPPQKKGPPSLSLFLEGYFP